MIEKRFVLFKGDNYYPAGGMRDYVGIFADIQSAIDAAGKPKRERWVNIAMWTTAGLVPILHRKYQWWATGRNFRNHNSDQWQWWSND